MSDKSKAHTPRAENSRRETFLTDASKLSSIAQADYHLREIVKYQQGLDATSSDARMLQGMLVHLENIQKSVKASSEDHVNAVKRLKDFSLTLEKMSPRLSSPPHESMGSRMTSLVAALRRASAELADTGTPPAWALPSQ